MKVAIILLLFIGLLPAPPATAVQAPPTQNPATYARALAAWNSIEHINRWIGRHFKYDLDRAIALSETMREKSSAPAVMAPQAIFNNPRGVCLDLARFAVETARRVEPKSKAAYLMIEFTPMRLKGQVLRRHWIAVFQREGVFFSFGDSNRPGHIAGPYQTLQSLVESYQAFRKRQVISYKLLNDFRKKKQKRLRKKSQKNLDWGKTIKVN